MNYDHYIDLKFTEDYHLFLFYSDGPKGRLKKLVVYSMINNLPDTFNLGFGTLKVNSVGNEYLDGTEISDNGDRDKILATIALTAYTFIDKYPDKKIYLTGSDKIRTRLYQMAIAYAYEELSEKFRIFGDISTDEDTYDLQPFRKGINYTGFLAIKR
jgi:hypothetical protein